MAPLKEVFDAFASYNSSFRAAHRALSGLWRYLSVDARRAEPLTLEPWGSCGFPRRPVCCVGTGLELFQELQ